MKKSFISVFTLFCVLSCTRHYIPKTGDIVFQDLDCGALCDAIEKVTSGIDNKDFSHVGIVSVENDTAFVYEAIGPGVIRTPFTRFIARSVDSLNNPKVLVGRIHSNIQYTIPGAISTCKELLGRPYDNVFDLKNQSYYCSELVYEAFRDSSGGRLFVVSPMTFKDPATGNTFPAWIDYYKELNAPIPEGKPGVNPGGISRSDIIDIVFKYY
jgi:hypothetical protein